MKPDIIHQLLAAHNEAQEARDGLRANTKDALIKWASVGRLLDLSGLTPEEVESIDPEIERWRLAYHSAKRLVAKHPDQLEFAAVKLLTEPHEEGEQQPAQPKRPMVETIRLASNLLKHVDKVDTAGIGDNERFALTSTLDKVIKALSTIRERL